jgi:hypothetical protein
MKGPFVYYPIKEMYGSDLSSTKIAKELGQHIMDEMDLDLSIHIDFQDVRSISNGWARNSLGLIVKRFGESYFKERVMITNMSKSVRTSILEGIGEVFV